MRLVREIAVPIVTNANRVEIQNKIAKKLHLREVEYSLALKLGWLLISTDEAGIDIHGIIREVVK